MSYAERIHPLPTPTEPADILTQGLEAAGERVSLACSFSVEDVVVIDLASRLNLPLGVFAIDTGRLNEETYEAAEAVMGRYGIQIDWYFPDRQAVESLESQKGLFSFRESLENRKECCRIRKVESLDRALEGLAGWVTGLRRDQSITRADLAPLETDAGHGGILKINPLIYWTEEEVWEYAKRRADPRKPPAPDGLSQHRMRSLHPGGTPRRVFPRRPLVVGGPRPQGVRAAPELKCSEA